MNRNIGVRLRIARESLGLDQPSFADSLGIASRDTISRWERGLAFPPADVLALLHDRFGINPGWIISGKGAMKGPGAN